MTIHDWLPAITTTGVLAAALWLFRTLVTNRLAKSVQHEYDLKLESVRTAVRHAEELFQSELRSKEREISSLRDGALSALTTRQVALDSRRIAAVEQIWKGTVRLARAKHIVSMMQAVHFERASAVAEKNSNVRDMFRVIADSTDPLTLRDGYPATARPFISEIAWALFSAYNSIVVMAVTRAHMLKGGVNAPDLFKTEPLLKMLQAALPHRADFIGKQGLPAAFLLLDELEEALLTELRRALRGASSDEETVAQAATIVRAAKQVDALSRENATTLETDARD